MFSSYDAEMGLAATPDALLDRINLLLMAGQMDSTLRSQILNAVSAIAIPSGDQNAINAALAARVQTAIYLTMASPSLQRAVLGSPTMCISIERHPAAISSERLLWPRWQASPPAHSYWNSTRWPRWRRERAPSDYRALVCVFLQGGNDGHGTVIATDPDSFAAFTQARSGAPGLAYPLSQLLPITLKTPQSGRTFALNPALAGVQNLFNAGRAAIVANTGTLIAPATKAQVNANSVPLPASLFSHFDQTAAWQAIASNGGSAEHVGWGGAVADLIESMNMNSNSMFTCISTAGIALFLSGQTSFQLNVTPAGPIPIGGLAQPLFGQSAGTNALASILTADETNLFAKEYEVVINRSIQAQALLASSMLAAGPEGFRIRRNILTPSPISSRTIRSRLRCRRSPGSSAEGGTGREPADLLCAARQLRYAQRPGRSSTRTC